MSENRVELIRERLTVALAPTRLEIEDDSAKHAGHAGARAGGGHFRVRITAAFSRTVALPSSRAFRPLARTSATPPSAGEQNIYFV